MVSGEALVITSRKASVLTVAKVSTDFLVWLPMTGFVHFWSTGLAGRKASDSTSRYSNVKSRSTFDPSGRW